MCKGGNSLTPNSPVEHDMRRALGRFEIGSIVFFGVIFVGIGILLFSEGRLWYGGSMVAIGGWIILDILERTRNRHRSEPTAHPPSNVSADRYQLTGRSSQVRKTLQTASRPLPKAELTERTDLSEAELEPILEIAESKGTVSRVGTGYELTDEREGVRHSIRAFVGPLVRRLLRPLRLFRPSG